jgi:hypothetical protein
MDAIAIGETVSSGAVPQLATPLGI